MVSLWPTPRPAAPPTVPTDTIIPVHYWDDTALCRSALLYDLMRFDERLDAGKLKTSLEKLLHCQGWRKLGARVRLNGNGKLDYHVPARFDDRRAPFSFHHEQLDLSITEHPLASRLPTVSTSSTPRVLGRGEDFIELMQHPGDPETLEDYLFWDRPLLGLRIISFADATLLTVSWPHIVLDGMGRKAFLEAWSLVLHGREDELLPLHGVETDPLATLGVRPSETYKHADKQLSAWQMAIWGVRYVFDKLWNRRRTEESRIVFVPAAYAKLLHETAVADIAQRSGEDGHVPFLSEGDVICAWWTRCIVRAQIPVDSTRTVAINNAFGLRRLLSEDLLPPSRAYVSNAFCMIPVFMAAIDLLTRPLGSVAAAIRKSYVDLGTRHQVEAVMGLSRAAQSRVGFALFGDAGMHLVVCTNWSKADLFNADFSGALVDQGRRSSGPRAGRPSFILAHAFAQGFSIINGFMVTGKDAGGNFWLYGVLRREYWSAVEEGLEENS